MLLSKATRMQIEKGKFYRSRDGHKVEIYSTDNPGVFPIHGRIFCDGYNATETWRSDGRNYSTMPEVLFDLISEWRDEPVVDWSLYSKSTEAIAMDKNGKWFEYGFIPNQHDSIWAAPGASPALNIKPAFCPKFSGDWKDSLVIRPKQ